MGFDANIASNPIPACTDGTNVVFYVDHMSQITQLSQPDSSLWWPMGSIGRGKGEGEHKREIIILKHNHLNAICLELPFVF